jgi:hypothetical protein
MLTDPAAIEAVLITQARQFRKHFAVRLLPIALGNGLFTSEGDFYTRQRLGAAGVSSFADFAVLPAFVFDRTHAVPASW